jgi:hypothetical protein
LFKEDEMLKFTETRYGSKKITTEFGTPKGYLERYRDPKTWHLSTNNEDCYTSEELDEISAKLKELNNGQ